MPKVLCLTFLLLCIICAKAQDAGINGHVTDSATASSIEYATVTLFKPGEKKAVTGTTTNAQGSFEMKGVAAGSYTILVEFVGYKPRTLSNITLSKKNELVDVGIIKLSKAQQMLKGVVVTSQTGLVENKIDKMVFNAEKDLTSQGGVATDVLKKVPQISVDIDGNVELAGSSSIRFLINGKPSTAFGSSIADVLQSIPASQIKSIEVVTNPGAKYDAEGLGGIINIILKQSKVKGINANISLTAGTRMENGSINVNARKGDFGIHAFASGNARLTSTTPTNYNRLTSDTAAKTNIQLLQDGYSRFNRHGVETGIGFDWTYKKKNNFSGAVNYNNFGNVGNGQLSQAQITTAAGGLGGIISEIMSLNNTNNAFHFHNVDANLNYKRTFDKEDQELEISVNSSFGHYAGNSGNYQYLQPQDSLYLGTSNNNPGKENETEVQLDYTQPFKKDVKLGVGTKFTARDINSNANVLSYQPATKSYATDAYLSNYLNYPQKVYAVYAELGFPISESISAKIGSRYERTEISSFYSNAQQQVATPGYNTLVPSIFFLKKLPGNQTLKLSYSKRIERPDYRVLNPFVNTADPKNISAGNPYLQPEIGNRFELSYNKSFDKLGSFMVAAFYRTSDHDIQPYIKYYDSITIGTTVYKNASVTTNQNIGIEKDAGLSIFGDIHFNTKFAVRTNLFLFHRNTINAVDAGLNSSSFNYRTNINASYQFTGTLAGEFFGNFSSARHEVQGRYPSFTSYSIALRKQFWNKKASLALMANNPFNEYVSQRVEVFGSNFASTSVRKVPFRSIGINFTWKFGKLEFKKDRGENGDNGGGAPEGN
jgi:ferric enterobactin receptor